MTHNPEHNPWLPGVRYATNIVDNTGIYEIENKAVDPECRLEAVMQAIMPWEGATILDLGAGAGYHTPYLARKAQHVFAVEPVDRLRLLAMERIHSLKLANVSVMTGSAEQLLLSDNSIDIVHARLAYFFGPGCEPGLKEIERVIRPGGGAFIIDNDYWNGQFASWMRSSRTFAGIDPQKVRLFWERHGFERRHVMSELRFTARRDLEDVIRMEFPRDNVDRFLGDVRGLSVGYGFCVYYKIYGGALTIA